MGALPTVRVRSLGNAETRQHTDKKGHQVTISNDVMHAARLHYALSFDIDDRSTEEWWVIRDDAFARFDEALKIIEAHAKAEALRDVADAFEGRPSMSSNVVQSILRARADQIDGGNK